jgi:hypothetical protein
VPAAAATPAEISAAPALDQLASTLGHLKASLSAIRREMEAMRPAAGGEPLTPAALCGAAADAAPADGVPDEADWRHAEAAMTGELINTRERLAAAEAAAAALLIDREHLVRRITELDELLEKAQTSAVVDGLVERQRVSIEPVAPAGFGAEPELSAASAPELLRVSRPALAGEAPATHKAAAPRDLARASHRLDLQAELALAQLRIVELNTALEASRLRQDAMSAEVTTLRSLTGGQIQRFLAPDG